MRWVAVLLAASLAGPTAEARQKVLIDADPGIDDAMAILFALQSPELEVLGITTVFGNAAIDVGRLMRYASSSWRAKTSPWRAAQKSRGFCRCELRRTSSMERMVSATSTRRRRHASPSA